MWELRKESARGRISLRRFSLLFMAMTMAIFTLSTLLAPQALAADAQRDGDTVTYDGRTFTPMTDAQRPTGVQSDVTGYVSLDETGKKAYFILTTGDASKATTGQYVIYDFTPPSHFSNSSPPVTVAIVDTTSTTTETNAADDATSCNSQVLQGIGWILCPVVNFLASGMDHLFDILTGFLVVQPAKATDDNSLFKMWGIVRGIANICFVIVFLIVIYSQITSIGISNYGIKKIMPRLVIAAILVNISFWICALAIDVSNVLGYGVHSLFMNVFNSLNTSDAYQNLTWSNVAVSVLSGTAVTALGAYGIYGALVNLPGLLIAFIPTLVGVLLSVLVALLVISVRQALITVLVIISPLAFVAYLMPNTEKYFTKWRELFMTLLLVYPIFAVVFGGAQLAGMAIIQNAGGALNLIILGMAVQVAPVVVTPLLIKVSGSLVGKIAALANNPRQAIMGKTRTWADGRAAERKARVLSDKNRNGRLVRLSRSLNDYHTGHEQARKEYEARDGHRFARTARGRQVERLRRQNINAGKRVSNAHDREFEDLEIESRNLDVTKSNIETNMMGSRAGRELKKRMDDSASYKKEVDNAFYRTESGRQARARSDRADIDKTRVDNSYNQSSIGKEVDRARRHVELIKERVSSDHQAEWDNAVRTDPSLLVDYARAKRSVGDAEKAKLKLEKAYSEIVTLGENSEHILNLRGRTGATDEQILSLGRDIRTNAYEISAVSMAKGNAERDAKEALAKLYSDVADGTASFQVDGVDIHKYAAGLKGQSGELAVLAKAKSETTVPLTEDIKNIKSTLSYLESTSPFELLKKFQDPEATLEQRVAYASVMTERGAPGNVALRQAIDYLDSTYATDPENTTLQQFKELLATSSGAMKSGKDIEFWLTNTRDKTNNLRTLKDLSNDKGTWNALQVDAFVGMNMISQLKALRTYARHNPDLYDQLVSDVKADSHSYAQLKPAVKEAMEHLASDATFWSDTEIRTRAGNPANFDFDNPW